MTDISRRRNNVVLEGRLLKAPPIASVEELTYKRWKRHKFTLTREVLSYKSRKKGVVDISVNSIKAVFPLPAYREREYLFGLSLVDTERVYFFEADSDFSRTTWMEKISSVAPRCTATRRNYAYKKLFQDSAVYLGTRIPVKLHSGEGGELVVLPAAVLLFDETCDTPIEAIPTNTIRSFGQTESTLRIVIGSNYSLGEGERILTVLANINTEPTFAEASQLFRTVPNQEYNEALQTRSTFQSADSVSRPMLAVASGTNPSYYTSIAHEESGQQPNSEATPPSGTTHFLTVTHADPATVQPLLEGSSRTSLVDTFGNTFVVTSQFFTGVNRLRDAVLKQVPDATCHVGNFFGPYSRDFVLGTEGTSQDSQGGMYMTVSTAKRLSYAKLDALSMTLGPSRNSLASLDSTSTTESSPRHSNIPATISEDGHNAVSTSTASSSPPTSTTAASKPTVVVDGKAKSPYVQVNFAAMNALAAVTSDSWADKVGAELGDLGNPGAALHLGASSDDDDEEEEEDDDAINSDADSRRDSDSDSGSDDNDNDATGDEAKGDGNGKQGSLADNDASKVSVGDGADGCVQGRKQSGSKPKRKKKGLSRGEEMDEASSTVEDSGDGQQVETPSPPVASDPVALRKTARPPSTHASSQATKHTSQRHSTNSNSSNARSEVLLADSTQEETIAPSESLDRDIEDLLALDSYQPHQS